MRAKVEIKNDGKHTHIFVDGQEIERVYSYTLTESADSMPSMDIEVMGVPAVVMSNVDVGLYTRYADNYLEWLDKNIDACGENISRRATLRECRAAYLSYFGEPLDDEDESSEKF